MVTISCSLYFACCFAGELSSYGSCAERSAGDRGGRTQSKQKFMTVCGLVKIAVVVPRECCQANLALTMSHGIAGYQADLTVTISHDIAGYQANLAVTVSLEQQVCLLLPFWSIACFLLAEIFYSAVKSGTSWIHL